MFRWMILSGCATFAALGWVNQGQSDPPPKPSDSHAIMRKKLELTQQLLRAVATEDFATTSEQSQQLAELTHDAAWLVHRTEEYRRESVEFERSAYVLAEAAKQKQLADTTLGFLSVTLSCVRCHRYLRETDDIEQREITVPRVVDKPDTKAAPGFWMAKKLQLSEAILSGLAVGDADSIAQSAEEMQTLSKVEGWARRKDAKNYRALLDLFQQANAELIMHAQQDDLDGAALAFTQITLSCVKCHHHLRNRGQDEAPMPAPRQ